MSGAVESTTTVVLVLDIWRILRLRRILNMLGPQGMWADVKTIRIYPDAVGFEL